MRSKTSPALLIGSLMATGLTLSGCGGVAARVTIPDSLRAPCVSTVDVSTARTVGDLGSAVVQGDADLRVCGVRKDAVIAIVEARNPPWWRTLLPD